LKKESSLSSASPPSSAKRYAASFSPAAAFSAAS